MGRNSVVEEECEEKKFLATTWTGKEVMRYF
jgi:hypothetical protein